MDGVTTWHRHAVAFDAQSLFNPRPERDVLERGPFAYCDICGRVPTKFLGVNPPVPVVAPLL